MLILELVKDRRWVYHSRLSGGMKRRDQTWLLGFGFSSKGRKVWLGNNAIPTKKQWINTKEKTQSKKYGNLRRKVLGFYSQRLTLPDDLLQCSSPTANLHWAAMLPRDYGGFCIQMRLHYSPFAPFFLHWIEWMDFSCTDPVPSFLGLFHILLYKVYVDGKPLVSPRERKATLKEFYAVIYPSLRQLQSGHVESKEETSSRKRIEDQKRLSNEDVQRDEECGICMENCRDVVLPNCGHSMCLSCFQDWSPRSPSCPFCRNCLKRLSSRDLWVLTSDIDIVNSETLAKENLLHFYLYMENLPLFQPDVSILIPDYML